MGGKVHGVNPDLLGHHSRLPHGWEARQIDQGKIYYMDHETKKTSWVNPNLLGHHSHLPDGWEARQTDQGKIYYMDHKTKTASWENPNLAKQLRGGLEEENFGSNRDKTSQLIDEGVPQPGLDQIWTPLQSTSGIRILKLLPGVGKQPIQCVLDIISLDGEECHYQRRSYTWGSLDNMLDITCNGMTFAITRNLHSALLRLRDKKHIVHLWVDTLCINQSKNSQARRERETQVKLMWMIFSRAAKVIVNLGEAVDHQKDFENFLQPLRNLPKNLQGSPEMAEPKVIEEHGLPGVDHACWPTLVQVLSQEYFKRVWIIQECVLATKLEFLLGTGRYEADFLEILLQANSYGMYLAARLSANLTWASEEGDAGSSIVKIASSPSAYSASSYASEIIELRGLWWAKV